MKNPGGLPLIDYRTLVPFQGDLKDFHEREYAKLKKSVAELGWVFPFFVWFEGETPRILDGHGRQLFAVREKVKPYELPYVRIDAANEQEAKKLLLVATSQYQRITQEGFDAFTFDMDEAWIGETVNFDGVFSGVSFEEEVRPPEVDLGRVEEAYETYVNNNIRQIVLYLQGEEYDKTLERLEKVMQQTGTEDNTSAVLSILSFYEDNAHLRDL